MFHILTYIFLALASMLLIITVLRYFIDGHFIVHLSLLIGRKPRPFVQAALDSLKEHSDEWQVPKMLTEELSRTLTHVPSGIAIWVGTSNWFACCDFLNPKISEKDLTLLEKFKLFKLANPLYKMRVKEYYIAVGDSNHLAQEQIYKSLKK